MELFLAIILPETFSQTLPEVTLFFRYRVLCPQRNYTRPTELSSVKYPLILNM